MVERFKNGAHPLTKIILFLVKLTTTSGRSTIPIPSKRPSRPIPSVPRGEKVVRVDHTSGQVVRSEEVKKLISKPYHTLLSGQ